MKITLIPITLCSLLLLNACNSLLPEDDTDTQTSTSQDGNDTTASQTNSDTETSTSEDENDTTASDTETSTNQDGNDGTASQTDTDEETLIENHLSSWIINNESSSSVMFSANGSILEDVQSAEIVSVQNEEYMYIEASGIPKYDVTMTTEIISDLNTRPRKIRDFVTGSSTTAVAGDVVTFGADIGYNSSSENCDDTGGAGYWPPGPGCPTEQTKEVYFPTEPIENEELCETGLGVIGLLVNGTSIYNWGDGMSYGDNLWFNLAPVAEFYDVDICGGHAASGDYHHHFYTSCLANLVGDDASGHSPIYGFASDGYPIYGPYESANTLAVSGWEIRDYGAATSEGGCGTEGERTCILNDHLDISQGVETVTAGADTDESVDTLSGNSLIATEGYFYEDYFYAQHTVTGTRLDEHNGHDTGDGKGYHYHITLAYDDDNNLTPSFPYTIGPSFKGELTDNSSSSCSSDLGNGPGGNMPPPMM